MECDCDTGNLKAQLADKDTRLATLREESNKQVST